MVPELRTLEKEFTNAQFYTSTETPDGWIEKQYAVNYSVWVTADSLSMVYEALTAGCCVGLLPVEWKRKDSLFQRSENYLLNNELVISYESWLKQDQKIRKVQPLDEANRCVKEILRRWWPDRLP